MTETDVSIWLRILLVVSSVLYLLELDKYFVRRIAGINNGF